MEEIYQRQKFQKPHNIRVLHNYGSNIHQNTQYTWGFIIPWKLRENARLYLENVKVMNPDKISTKKWVQRYIKVRYPWEEIIASLLFWIFAWPAA